MTKTANAQAPGQHLPKRKPHRRGAPRTLTPTGASLGNPPGRGPNRLCVACRGAKPARELMQLRDLGATLMGGKASPSGRHAYVCLQRACLQRLGERMAGGKGNALAGLAFLAQLSQLATTRLTGIIGLARRQGLLTMGAARIIALRPPKDSLDDDDLFEDDDDDDDDEDEDTIDADDDDVILDDDDADLPPQGHARASNTGQDVILVACDAAPRTRRALGPEIEPCMLLGAELGHAAGGAPVAAVGIPAGRLALQAAYWLQVWYEARLADAGVTSDVTTPESMIN